MPTYDSKHASAIAKGLTDLAFLVTAMSLVERKRLYVRMELAFKLDMVFKDRMLLVDLIRFDTLLAWFGPDLSK